MRSAIWFVLGAGVSGGTLALAAPGDMIYQHTADEVAITRAQAACFADCAISAGAWDGARADLTQVCAQKDGVGAFRARASGLKTSAPSDLATRAAAGEEIRVVGSVQ